MRRTITTIVIAATVSAAIALAMMPAPADCLKATDFFACLGALK
jgi:Spy/CpxP family protein refolding chaperone